MEKKVFLTDDLIKLLIGGVVGYVLFTLTSHPSSHVHKRIPQKNVRGVTILPHIKLMRKNKVLHMHHWMIFSFVYFWTLFLRRGILSSKLLHGFILGVIMQGLSYNDRFRIYYPVIETTQ